MRQYRKVRVLSPINGTANLEIMTSTRQLKFARLLQKELGDIFQKDQKSLFSDNILSVTFVEVSPDFSIAHVQLSLLLDKGMRVRMKCWKSERKQRRHQAIA
jgi:ribosome-binding factor A